MAFWGVELNPGEPFTHHFHKGRGRLHISKATLGIITGNMKDRSIVQCKTGNRSPIFLLSLRPLTKESCSVDAEFDEEEGDVVFEVLGPTSVHLIGFYVANGPNGNVLSDKGEENDAKYDAYKEAEVEAEMKKGTKQPEVEYRDVEVNGLRKRTFPTGLVIEDLEMENYGTGYAEMATPGSRVEIYYSAQLKSNGFIFESNFCSSPLRFKYGAGEVIAGLEFGINGMRARDKRRITIPPSLAYGSKGREHVPPDSWVVYEVLMRC